MNRTTAALLLAFLVGCGTSPGASGPNTPGSTDDEFSATGGKSAVGGELSAREKATLERLLEETYAPCPDQAVTIAACLEEKRACRACEPAARFLTDRVKSGSPRSDIQRAYGLRFGNDVRKVDVADSPARGPADAPITIIIWSDFECPACGRIVPAVERIAEKHAREVRLVHKLYPLKDKHPNAETAARAAIAAQRQGRFWEMEKLLFENQKELGGSKIEGFAKDLKLDMGRFRADMQDAAATRTIARDQTDADRSGLTGTPFILINGREFDLGLFRPEPDLETWIATEIELGAPAK
jgi:protein-disulfide isomerase